MSGEKGEERFEPVDEARGGSDDFTIGELVAGGLRQCQANGDDVLDELGIQEAVGTNQVAR